MDPILVLGGGIGGLAAALALARAGFPIQLFERSVEFQEVGAGIQLGPNAFAMFERLGIRAAVEQDAVRPDALVMRCAVHGHEITRIPLDGMPARYGNPYAVTHRADLHRSLLQACRAQPGIALHTARPGIGFVQDAAGITLMLEGGESLRGAALIGADGIWSRTRQAVIGDGRPTISGHVAYRAVLPMGRVPVALRQHQVTLWAGPRLHLVTYPLRRGELMNLVAVFHSADYTEGWDQAGDTSLLWQHFSGMQPEVLELLQLVETWRFWVLGDRDPRRGWSQGRVTLLGDAAHPMLQYLAQGATMAVEDAVCLADQLALHGDVPKALAEYESHRVLRTGRVQVTARLFGEIYHAAGVRAELRDQWLAGRDPVTAREAMAWLYQTPEWPKAF